MDFNKTSYPLEVKSIVNKLDEKSAENEDLKLHQYIPKEFFTTNDIRGLLIVHAMGMGKTRLAVAIAEYYSENDPYRKINILLPKALENNFRKNILDYSKKENTYVESKYKFMSLNASNLYKKVETINLSDEEIKMEKRLGEFMEDITRKNSLNNSLLIIDEAHNLFNGITNGSKNAVKLYDLIINAKNLKILFLTGTPIINNPFELIPCFNMLRGPIYIGDKKGNKTRLAVESSTLLFSEKYDEFETYFINNDKIKNREKFKNRIYGLVSYYGDIYFDKDREGFPEKLKTVVEKIPMSNYQYNRYTYIRSLELEEEKKKKSFRDANARFSSSSGGGGTYRVKSRQVCNYAIPEYALGPIIGKKSRQKFLNKITTEDLKNLKKFSPKFEKMLNNIKKHNNLGIVYSQFVSGEGLNLFARILESLGWFNYGDIDSGDLGLDIKIKNKKNTFAILSGNISVDERTSVINLFNSKDNMTGSRIKLLLLSGAVAEGIDLKRVRHVHIMEPFWNYARIRQVETRAIRYNSHIDLPKKEQNVQTYIYLSSYPISVNDKDKKESTTDVDLYKKSILGMKLIDNFSLALAESSIDCTYHIKNLPKDKKNKIKCKLCTPNDKPLYNPILEKDIIMENNCLPYKEQKVEVTEIALDDSDEKFYYKYVEDDITLYYFSKELDSFTQMPRGHKYYGDLINAIIQKHN